MNKSCVNQQINIHTSTLSQWKVVHRELLASQSCDGVIYYSSKTVLKILLSFKSSSVNNLNLS